MITANAAGAIKAAMSSTRSRIAAITMNRLEAMAPGRAATMARLRRLNAKTTDNHRRVGQRTLQERLLPRRRPLIARVQEFRALKYWTESNYGSLPREYGLFATELSSQDTTQPCECCTEYGGKAS